MTRTARPLRNVKTAASASKGAGKRSRAGNEGTKLAVQIADAIERKILDRRYSPDTFLGSEAELLVEYSVSRAVLREAVLLLEQRQIALRRRGAGGGVLVRAPDVSSVARSIALYLECVGVGARYLLDARILLEEHCVRQALASFDAEKVADLRTHLMQGAKASGEEAIAGIARFHVLLAQLSANPVWTLVTEALLGVAADETRRRGVQMSAADVALRYRQLLEVADAIAAKQEARAITLLRTYIEEVTNRAS